MESKWNINFFNAYFETRAPDKQIIHFCQLTFIRSSRSLVINSCFFGTNNINKIYPVTGKDLSTEAGIWVDTNRDDVAGGHTTP